jgi:hypothetical protein
MSEDLAGKKVRCASCQSVVTAPADAGASAAIKADAGRPPKAAVSTADDRPRERDEDEDRSERRRRRSSSDNTGAAVAAAGAGLGIGAIIAIIVAIVGALGCCGVVAILIALLVPAVQKVREAAARTQNQNNLKQIALAVHMYHDTHRMLPPPKAFKNPQDTKSISEISWRVSILPFMEQQMLFTRFDMGVAWDNPKNQPLVTAMPMPYQDVARQDPKAGPGTVTPYQYFTGPNTLWPDNGKHTIMEITAGASNTFLCAEGANMVPWTKPQDMSIQPAQPPPLPPNQFQVAFCDGSVRLVQRNRAPDLILFQYMNPKDPNGHAPLD